MSRRLPLLRSYQLVRAGWSWNPSKRRPSGTGRPARPVQPEEQEAQVEMGSARFRLRATCGLAGPAAFTAAWVAGTLRQAGYSVAEEHLSGLAAPDARDPEIMIVGFLALGVCTFAFASALEEALGGRGRGGPAAPRPDAPAPSRRRDRPIMAQPRSRPGQRGALCVAAGRAAPIGPALPGRSGVGGPAAAGGRHHDRLGRAARPVLVRHDGAVGRRHPAGHRDRPTGHDGRSGGQAPQPRPAGRWPRHRTNGSVTLPVSSAARRGSSRMAVGHLRRRMTPPRTTDTRYSRSVAAGCTTRRRRPATAHPLAGALPCAWTLPSRRWDDPRRSFRNADSRSGGAPVTSWGRLTTCAPRGARDRR